MEAGFLYLDGPAVLHQGTGCGLFDGPISYEHYVRKFEPLTRIAARYRQRVVKVPFNMGHPIWEMDPNFDIRYHIQEIKFPEPVTEKQLKEFVCKIHAEPFDLSRPLWQTFIINGVEGGRSAIVGKMHHAISDGRGIMVAQAMVYETERVEPPDISELPEIQPPPPLPKLSTPVGRLLDALKEHAITIGKGVIYFPQNVVRAIRYFTSRDFRAANGEWYRFIRAKGEKYPFSRPNCGKVNGAAVSISIDDVRAIRAVSGGTINDVLVTVVAGALEKYGEKHGIPTEGRHAKMAFTANLRKPNDSERLDNRSAAAMVAVPFDIKNLRERLSAVTERTRIAKDSGMPMLVWNFIATWRAILTPPGLAIVYSIFSRPLAQRFLHLLMFKCPAHLYFSNVRAPEFPVYIQGRELIRRSPMPPLIPLTGISCVAVNMHKVIRLCFSADAESVKDVDDLANFTVEAFEDLRRAFPDAVSRSEETVQAEPTPTSA